MISATPNIIRLSKTNGDFYEGVSLDLNNDRIRFYVTNSNIDSLNGVTEPGTIVTMAMTGWSVGEPVVEKTKLDPNVIPEGDGWYHRIDAIPPVYSRVEIITTQGDLYTARVIPATAADIEIFDGIGCDVKYDVIEANGLSGATVMLTGGVAWIRELGDDQ